ncbi:SHOCT domain-containing protein [Kiritimatiellota bacterium B12222]|nr:SHOCT domain-containing protein [Kiritimatiellota bacterium B12222]
MNIKTTTLCLSLVFAATASHSLFADAAAPTAEVVTNAPEFLFVQNAEFGSFADGRLTFKGNAPVIFFSDRPYRVTGHAKLQEFIDSWDSGEGSFAQNPPNAVLSILGDEVQSFVVVLSDPQLTAESVSYKVDVEEGNIPAEFKDASLFIDNEAWAAVGGIVAGRATARRSQEREAAAYSQGQLSAQQSTAPAAVAPAPAPAPAPAAAPAASSSTPEQQLAQLKQMLDNGLITQDQYNAKQKEILANL